MLQRALKADVDEAAWAELYSTKSRPFDRPETGKIAVNVINHYGDEALNVFALVLVWVRRFGKIRHQVGTATFQVAGFRPLVGGNFMKRVQI